MDRIDCMAIIECVTAEVVTNFSFLILYQMPFVEVVHSGTGKRPSVLGAEVHLRCDRDSRLLRECSARVFRFFRFVGSFLRTCTIQPLSRKQLVGGL